MEKVRDIKSSSGVARRGSIAGEKDPAVMAAIIEVVGTLGRCTTRRVASALFRRGISTNKADAIRREFQFLEWIEPATTMWRLTSIGQTLITSQATRDPERFARQLSLAHEQRWGLISRLLVRMWDLNPKQQGAVIIQKQPLDRRDVPERLPDLRLWLEEQVAQSSLRLSKQMPGLSIVGTVERPQEIASSVIKSLAPRWESMRPYQRRQRLQQLVSDKYTQFMFGDLLTPRQVDIWQARLAWAGLTHTAYELRGIAFRVWFPVGAFRAEENKAFTPVKGLTSDGKTFYRHTPSGADFIDRFSDTLFEGYRQQQRIEPVRYVALQAVRDWVCYQLRISHSIFQEQLQKLFARSLRGEGKYMLGLEVDLTPQERQRYQHLNIRPVMMNGSARYIITMRTR